MVKKVEETATNWYSDTFGRISPALNYLKRLSLIREKHRDYIWASN